MNGSAFNRNLAARVNRELMGELALAESDHAAGLSVAGLWADRREWFAPALLREVRP